MSDDDFARLVDEMAAKWGVGGMDAGTIYGQFAIEVAKEATRRLLDERAKALKLLKWALNENIEWEDSLQMVRRSEWEAKRIAMCDEAAKFLREAGHE